LHVVVIGGGLMGTATAWFLVEAGHEVTLLDRSSELAAEGSFANGGILHAGHAAPWNSPAVAGQLLRWVGREESPLLLRPGRLPHMTRWGVGFLRHCRARDHEHVKVLNTRLALYGRERMAELRAATGIAYDGDQRGSMKIFRDRVALEAARSAAESIETLGIRSHVLDAEGVLGHEPALADTRASLVGGIHFPDDESGDACRFVRELGRMLVERGASVRTGEPVLRIEGDRSRVRSVVTARDIIQALARPLGLRLPIEPAKGYSVTLPVDDGPDVPRMPLIDEAHRVVITRLGGRLRIAGTVEFAGFDREIRGRRVEVVRRQGLSNLPSLDARLDPDASEPWACLRPVSIDGAPILGVSPIPNLFLNTAPGHLGWTLAAAAGRIVADQVSDHTPGFQDIGGLGAGRFRFI
jgi:D-amino-acid dehydrogenase